MKHVSSRQHPLVRTFRALADRPDPAGRRLLLDGVHLVRDAVRAGIHLDVAAIADTHLEADTEVGRVAGDLRRAGADVIAVSDRVLAAMSPVRSPSGIVALATREPDDLDVLCRTPGAFLVMAVDVQDPGNLGSLVRAAEAAGATGMLVGGLSANPFSWKSLRGSMGSALRLPIVAGLDPVTAVAAFHEARLRVIASVARGGVDPDDVDWRGSVGLLLGGEGPGLSDTVVTRADARVTIPMHPSVESLNVAVAGGILCYAARRQRR